MPPATTPWRKLFEAAQAKNDNIGKRICSQHLAIVASWPILATIGSNGGPTQRTLASRGWVTSLARLRSSAQHTDAGSASEDPGITASQLAHCDPQARRTLPTLFAMVTDARSAKIGELLAAPTASVLYNFPDTREQWRFTGTAHLILPPGSQQQRQKTATLTSASLTDAVDWQDVRMRVWRALSPKTAAQFVWPPPRQPRKDQDADSEPGQDGVPDYLGFHESVEEKDAKAQEVALKNMALIIMEVQDVDFLDLSKGAILYRSTWRYESTSSSGNVAKGVEQAAESDGAWTKTDINP